MVDMKKKYENNNNNCWGSQKNITGFVRCRRL